MQHITDQTFCSSKFLKPSFEFKNIISYTYCRNPEIFV